MVGIIIKGILVPSRQAEERRQLGAEVNQAIVADVASGDALGFGDAAGAVSGTEIFRFLADDERILEADLITLIEGMIQ